MRGGARCVGFAELFFRALSVTKNTKHKRRVPVLPAPVFVGGGYTVAGEPLCMSMKKLVDHL